MEEIINLEKKYCAANYQPLPIVLQKAEGVYVWDVEKKRYLDMMSAYSSASHGHSHPRILNTLTKQAACLANVSRAFHTDKLGLFLKKACEMTGFDKALPMNTGAEAVETALKAARKWAYLVKKVPEDQAEIIVCQGNFHGRTLAIVSLSTESQYRHGFGPFIPGIKIIPYGDVVALKNAITANTAAFLVEPIQGEAGIVVPPDGYLKQCEEICRLHNVLLIVDEVQTGLGRTGKLLASDHENVKSDGLILGKALGGGLFPVSLFLAKNEVMDVFSPGDHGSTFGGNPLAAAIGLEALQVLLDEDLVSKAEKLGEYFLKKLRSFNSPLIKEVRGKGLFIGLEIDIERMSARAFCLKLLEKGLLSKETHETVVRLAPPLIITQEQIKEALHIIEQVLLNSN